MFALLVETIMTGKSSRLNHQRKRPLKISAKFGNHLGISIKFAQESFQLPRKARIFGGGFKNA